MRSISVVVVLLLATALVVWTPGRSSWKRVGCSPSPATTPYRNEARVYVSDADGNPLSGLIVFPGLHPPYIDLVSPANRIANDAVLGLWNEREVEASYERIDPRLRRRTSPISLRTYGEKKRAAWIRAEGYAWKRLEFQDPGEYRLVLSPGTDVRACTSLPWLHESPFSGPLTVRNAGRTFTGRITIQHGDEIRIRGLDLGPLELQFEGNDLWSSRELAGQVSAELSDRREVTLDLELHQRDE